MSMRALIAAANEFSSLLNEVNASGRELTQNQMKKIQDLTNDEVWWTRAQAIITGISSAFSGIANAIGSSLPATGQIGPMSVKTVKTIVKSIGTGSTAIGDLGGTLARGQTIHKQSERSLRERCEISRLQQEDNTRNSHYSQVIQAIQGIMSAKARLS